MCARACVCARVSRAALRELGLIAIVSAGGRPSVDRRDAFHQRSGTRAHTGPHPPPARAAAHGGRGGGRRTWISWRRGWELGGPRCSCWARLIYCLHRQICAQSSLGGALWTGQSAWQTAQPSAVRIKLLAGSVARYLCSWDPRALNNTDQGVFSRISSFPAPRAMAAISLKECRPLGSEFKFLYCEGIMRHHAG